MSMHRPALRPIRRAIDLAARTWACALIALASLPATAASLTWDWATQTFPTLASPTAQPVASGIFTTDDVPDADGFYLITAITGSRLGVSIIALQPTGTAIPDNAPYAVDNRIRTLHPQGQLSKAGFGYQLANGWYENPFVATWLLPDLAYYAFLSMPPFGTATPQTEEPRVLFEASIRVPEPSAISLWLGGLLAFAWVLLPRLRH